MLRRFAIATLIVLAAAQASDLAPAAHAKTRAQPAAHARTAVRAKPKASVKPASPATEDRAAAPAGPASTLPFEGLLGLGEAEARARLGPPDIARAEGRGALWTYRLPGCALFVFFRAAEGQPLKISGAASGPRRRGQSPLPVERCIAQAAAAPSGSSAQP